MDCKIAFRSTATVHYPPPCRTSEPVKKSLTEGIVPPNNESSVVAGGRERGIRTSSSILNEAGDAAIDEVEHACLGSDELTNRRRVGQFLTVAGVSYNAGGAYSLDDPSLIPRVIDGTEARLLTRQNSAAVV
jgi:hypothetical protein